LLPLLFYSRSDFDARDLGGQSISFFAMMTLASQKLLSAVKAVSPLGGFGLKMLCGELLQLLV